jgi:predicted nucleotidyltransferase
MQCSRHQDTYDTQELKHNQGADPHSLPAVKPTSIGVFSPDCSSPVRCGSNPVEGFYLETTDGLFFAVKGLVHPPDRVIGVLRFLPDSDNALRITRSTNPLDQAYTAPLPASQRHRNGIVYRRVYHFDEQVTLLTRLDPLYLAFDPVFGEQLQGVPWDHIVAVHDPRTGLAQLQRRKELDPVERDTLAFAALLKKEAEIPESALGVSGSVLIGLHTSASDLDLVVYGEPYAHAVQAVLRNYLASPGVGPIRSLDEQGLATLYAARVTESHMSFEDFVRHEQRKVIQGYFCRREYFIRFVQYPTSINESYGDRTYHPIGWTTIRARVNDDRQALFTPCCYGITDVQFPNNESISNLTEIISFRGRFCEQARVGETLVAAGKVERVHVTEKDRVWHRLLVGNQTDDYILTEVTK